MKIRHANPKDIPALSKFIRSIISSTPYYTIAAKKEEIRKHNSQALKGYFADKKYYTCLLAVQNNDILGFVIGRNEAGVFWTDWVGVNKNFRRKGVAESLMNSCENYLKQRSVHKIWCDTRTSNKGSVALFLKLGYKKLGLFNNGWYKQDFFLWEKNLI